MSTTCHPAEGYFYMTRIQLLLFFYFLLGEIGGGLGDGLCFGVWPLASCFGFVVDLVSSQG